MLLSIIVKLVKCLRVTQCPVDFLNMVLITQAVKAEKGDIYFGFQVNSH